MTGALLLYALYVGWGTSAILAPLPVLLATAAALGVTRRQLDLARRWLSAAFMLVGALHLSLIGPAAPAPLVQLGLATAVTASALVSLAVDLTPRRLGASRAAVLVLAVACVTTLKAPMPVATVAPAALAGAILAWLRPLGALAAARLVALDGPIDPALWWRPQGAMHGPLR